MVTMREDILDMVDEMIDMDGEVKISGSTFSRSRILKELDPVAYRELVIDLIDSRISDLEYDIQCLDEIEDADEIAELYVQLVSCKNFRFELVSVS